MRATDIVIIRFALGLLSGLVIIGVSAAATTAGNEASTKQSELVQKRFMAGSHKAGSTLVHWMTDSACKSLGRKRQGYDPRIHPPGFGPQPYCMEATTNFGGHSSHCANDKTALKACPDWNGDGHKHHFPSPSCCLFPPFPWEAPNVNFRAVFFLRDPIKLIVSHFWFHFDGHERPKPAEMYRGIRKGDLYVPQNITKGLLHEMSPKDERTGSSQGYGKAAQMMGVLSELVHRNPPHMAKFTCLEDIMVDEDSVIGVWKAAFDFIGLPITEAQLREDEQFSSHNPRAPNVDSNAVSHSGEHDKQGRSRERMRLQNAYQVLALDPIASAPYANVSFFSSFRALSNQVGCWNWTDNTRGSLDDPWLLKPARLENTSEQFYANKPSSLKEPVDVVDATAPADNHVSLN